MSTISTGLFNSSGALTAPVINANAVNFTNPIRYLTTSNAGTQNNVIVPPTSSSLAGKTLVVQGGTQTSAFTTCTTCAALGAHVYVLARTKYWFDIDVESHNAGMFGPTYSLQDASNGLVAGVYTNNDSSANVINDRLPTFTFPGGGFIKFLATDARVPYVAKLDASPTTHAGYIANNSKYAAQPYLKELAWFSVDTSGGSNFGNSCPSISVRGAFQYIMIKELYITEVLSLGGTGSEWSFNLQSFVNWQVYNAGSDSTNIQWNVPIMEQFVGSENMVNEIVQFADDAPDKNTDRVTLQNKIGCGHAATVSNAQLYTRTAVASELYKLQFSNVDASGKIIGIRFGSVSSISGLPDVDGDGNGFRMLPYNLCWKLARQINLQMSTQALQLGMTTFMAGLGGVQSKSLGFISFPQLSHFSMGWALDPSGWAANGSLVGVSPPLNHFDKLNNLPGNASYDASYLNLHNSITFLPVNGKQRMVIKNYHYDASNSIGGVTLNPTQWAADQTVATSPAVVDGTWIDAIALSQTVGLDLLYGFLWAALAVPSLTPVPGDASTQLTLINAIFAGAGLKIKIHPLGFAVAMNGTTWGFGAGVQTKTPISNFNTMRPFECGSGFYRLFYDNVPFTNAGYFQLDSSPYNGGVAYTGNPVMRFNTQASNGLLPTVLPTVGMQNGGQMSTSNWNKTFAAGAGFDFVSGNPYNVGGLAPYPR